MYAHVCGLLLCCYNRFVNILVLCHRPNTERNSWYTLATPGRAESFLVNQRINVLDAWKEFICSRTHRSLTGEHLMRI